MTTDIFTPIVHEAERRQGLLAYDQYLRDRDGMPDVVNRTLSRREETMRRFLASDPEVRFDGPFDPTLFAAQHARFDRTRDTPQAMLLLLTLVKINALEAYGVEAGLRKAGVLDALERGEGPRGIQLMVLLEEIYHTKLLLTATNHFGVVVESLHEPPRPLKALVEILVNLPEQLSRSLTLASEALGVVMLCRLLSATRTILAGQPELRDALEERVVEILIDEVGHVSFCRLCLGPSMLSAARVFLPMVALGMRHSVPEGQAIGVYPVPWRDLASFELRQLPELVRRRAFIA